MPAFILCSGTRCSATELPVGAGEARTESSDDQTERTLLTESPPGSADAADVGLFLSGGSLGRCSLFF